MSFKAVTAYRFPVPASFFGMVLGLVGLGNCWRTAARLWGAPGSIGELAPAMFVIASVVIGVIFVRTVWLLTRGRLLPVPPRVATAV